MRGSRDGHLVKDVRCNDGWMVDLVKDVLRGWSTKYHKKMSYGWHMKWRRRGRLVEFKLLMLAAVSTAWS